MSIAQNALGLNEKRLAVLYRQRDRLNGEIAIVESMCESFRVQVASGAGAQMNLPSDQEHVKPGGKSK